MQIRCDTGTTACKIWNQNVKPLSVKGPLIYPIYLPVPAHKTVEPHLQQKRFQLTSLGFHGHMDPTNKQTMGFPCLPELHPSTMFVTEVRKTRKIKDFTMDHVAIFAGKWANQRKLRTHAQLLFSRFSRKGFSVVSQQILFRRKGIYLQIK